VTRHARLTEPRAGDPFARVAGLTVLHRQLLTLQDAGIEDVEVEGLPADQLPDDPRLTFRFGPAGAATAQRAAIRARIGLLWHRALPARLVQAGYQGDIEAAPLEPGEFVIAASDDATRRQAEALLFRSLIKPTDGLISRALNRPISLRVTRLLINTHLTPNQMTLIAGGFGIAAIALVAVGGAAWLVPGAVLLQVQSILDGCDGEISRLKYIRSRLGEWLDQVLDDVVNVGFFAAAGWALHLAGSRIALPIAIAGTAFHLIYQAALYTALITRGGGSGSITSIRWWGQKDHTPQHGDGPAPGWLRLVKQSIEAAMRRDFFVFLFLPMAFLGLTEVALVWCGFIFAGSGLATGLQWLLRGGPTPAERTS
jgi:phosphatidylglycerophosphate synthase